MAFLQFINGRLTTLSVLPRDIFPPLMLLTCANMRGYTVQLFCRHDGIILFRHKNRNEQLKGQKPDVPDHGQAGAGAEGQKGCVGALPDPGKHYHQHSQGTSQIPSWKRR